MNKRISLAGLMGIALLLVACGDDGSEQTCGPSNCAGCCTAGGACAQGDNDAQCGTGGALCSACQSGTCSAGKCVAGCDATTCPDGCCQDDQCMSGKVPSACGKGGQACAVCQGGESCNDGMCQSTTTCDATTCPGCCQGEQCMPGVTDAACGSGGVPCAGCQVPAETCINQICSSGPTCDASTCASGCCDSQGQCMPGNLDTACGTGGAPCEPCPAGNTCTSQQCQSPGGCGPCAGCCDGQSCIAGTTDALCGSGGVACEACQTFQICATSTCEVKPDSDWDVTVVDGEIAKPPLGQVWDPNAIPGFQEPDVYVQVTSGGQTGQTGVDDNKYTPSWNKQVLTVKAQDLKQSVALTVMDEELFPPHQLMAQCTVTIAEAEFVAGARTVVNCGGTDVLKINLKLTAK